MGSMENRIASTSNPLPGSIASDRPEGWERLVSIDKLSVLVVDDDTDWASECAFNLSTVGCRPFIAKNAEEALSLADRHQITIAIVDYNLPDDDGISLIEKLTDQAERQGRQLGLIMATGYATLDLAVAAMRVSVVDFLQKPITPSELREAIQRIHGLRQTKTAREELVTRLSSLSGDLQRLAGLITPDKDGDARSGLTPEDITPDMVRKLIRVETRRRDLAGGALFGDSAWYMLLDLLLAKLENRQVSVSSACIGSGSPMSTAMRLVRRLVDSGILHRLPDQKDGRRDFLVLDGEMEKLMLEYLCETNSR